MSKQYDWILPVSESGSIFSNIEAELRSMFGNIKKGTLNGLTVVYPFSAIFGGDQQSLLTAYVGVIATSTLEARITFISGQLPPQEGTKFYYRWERYSDDIVDVITNKVGKPPDSIFNKGCH